MITGELEARAWLQTLPEWTPEAQARLERLVELLCEENLRQNLVSGPSLDQVWTRHIVDSAQLLLHVPRETPDWLDLGTGAGFPGMVVAALRPDCRVVMVEPRKRRVEWLETLQTELGLPSTSVIGERLENVPSEQFCAISARAFAPLDRLLTLASRFSTSESRWLLPKGRSATQELAELKRWRPMFHVEQSLTDPEAGIIVGTLPGGKGLAQ